MLREDKTTQMAAQFLELAGGRLTRIHLMGLLYAADRRMLTLRGKPITYDQWFRAEQGPVLGATLELIRSNGVPSAYWSRHIATRGDSVFLVSDPGDDDLSLAEAAIIGEIFREWWLEERPEMLEVRRRFPEWSSPGSLPGPISYDEVLRLSGFSQDEVAGIVEGIAMQDAPYRLLRTA